MIDPSLGDGCLIKAAYQDGSVVRIGFDRLAGDGYVAAFNDAWGGIEEGGVYDIQFVLDGEYSEVMSIDLGGTFVDLEAVVTCQNEMG